MLFTLSLFASIAKMSDSAKEDDEEKGTQTLMDEEPENDGETTQANDPDIAEDQEEDSYDSGFDYVPAISAQPPKVVQQEEGQMEVSASPAFQCLDEVSWTFFYKCLNHLLGKVIKNT